MKTQLSHYLCAICIVMTSTTAMAQQPEPNISAAMNHTYEYEQVDDIKMAYYEQGSGEPVLFLHGIPDNSYLWRNVVPEVATTHRAIAMDMPGYGKSDIPSHDDYSIDRYYQYVEGFINNMGLTNVTLVVTDIGSLYGLQYALKHSKNIKGIVLIEAMYMPSEEWYKSLKFMQKMMFGMMKNEKRANRMIVEKNVIPRMMLKMSVKRKYDDDLENKYNEPYKDNVDRRKVMLYGAGPHTVPKKGRTMVKGDFADRLNTIAEGLKRLNATVPFLIIHGDPGMIVRKSNIEYAKTHFKNVSFHNIGKGKHYLSEDHPKAIGDVISKWSSEIEK